ncbi:unnamed protein product, partial [Brassica oleracea]
RRSRAELRTISQVCWRWRRFLRSQHFATVRKMSGSLEEFMCVLVNNMYWEVIDCSGNKLGRIPTGPGPFKCGYGLAVLDGQKIVFVGGKYKFRRSSNEVRGLKVRESAFANAALANVSEFNPATNRWRKLADMNIPRHNFGYAVVDRLLYVIRGYTADDVIILNAEVYNPKTNKWSLMNCPHRPNFLPAFSFSFNSKLFVVGNELRFIDIYDPRTKTWEEFDSGQTLSVHSYTVVRNKVYFLNYNIPGMGVFDPEKNSWSWVSVPRADFRFKLGQWNNKVILSGYHATSVLINC